MVGGPGSLRFFLQPTIAILLGILHGMRDHHAGRPPYLVGLVRARGNRLRLLAEALRQIMIPLLIAVLAAYVFQYVIRGRVYLLYGLLYAAVFVALPYIFSRGLTNRLTPHQRRLAG